MGSLRASKALLAGETKNVKARRKPKGKENRNSRFEPNKEFYLENEALSSKKEKYQRFDEGK